MPRSAPATPPVAPWGLEAAPDAMVVVDQAGRIVLVNLQVERRFGYPRGELLGQPIEILVPEGLAERLTGGDPVAIRDALAEQVGTGIELVGRRKDRAEFPIEVTLAPHESAEGIRVTVAIRDVTERKEDERQIAQLDGRYRGLLEAAPDAMIVVDRHGIIVLLNVQAEKRFGYRRDELLAQPVRNIIPAGFAERLLADALRSAADARAQQIGTGIELTGRRKDGTEFPLEIMLSPFESPEGIVVTAAIRDISSRKAAERHLIEMEARYRALLEAAPDAMVVVNEREQIVLLNVQAEKKFGYPRHALLGRQITEIVPDGFAERLIVDGLRSPAEALGQKMGAGVELSGRRKDGTRFPMELMLSPLESADGILVTAAIRDITARKHAEQQLLHTVDELKRSNQELEHFASVASHDLQEPLRMVASYTQLLSRRYKGRLDADADEFIGYAVDGASRMQRLIQDLLLYSRVGTKGAPLIATSSEAALVRALRHLQGVSEDAGAEVTHDPLPDVRADPTQLIQLFQNLVGNAIKYRRPVPPRVHVSAVRDEDGRWLFSVTDNGIGIESKHHEKIFGMFQRLHGRDEFPGSGIGLAICQKIVVRHGGQLSITSQYGQGSTFQFQLAGVEAA